MQGILHLLGADKVDMAVHATCGQDAAFASDHFGTGSDDNINAGLCVGVAGLADGVDEAVFQRDIRFINTRMIHDQRVRDDRIHGTTCAGDLGLAHAVADHLAAAKFHLFAVSCQVALDLDHQISVGKAKLVTRGRAIHRGVMRAGNLNGHYRSPMIC